MRKHALSVGPQPRGNQFLLLAGRKMNKAVNSAANPHNAADLLVVGQQCGRIAGGGGLLGRE